MFHIEENKKKVGAYLKKLIEEKYGKVRPFCKEYLRLQNVEANDEEVRKVHNRFIQIFNGSKAIQTYDLPIVSELLSVSCEQILTAGKFYTPISGHITNYEIAFSHDRDVWERYMKREDKLFLNCDEYCKSVIDYALEFKNYDFIKYLIDEHFIWFVDIREWRHLGKTFGAGTSIKRREIAYIDTYTPLEIKSQDELRLNTIALAIENDDFEVLDSLKAREIPEMSDATMFGCPRMDYPIEPNKKLIQAIAATSDDKVIDYFSSEFSVSTMDGKHENMFLYPHTGILIDELLKNGRDAYAETVLRKANRHNKQTLEKLNSFIQDAIKFYYDSQKFRCKGIERVVIYNALEWFLVQDKCDLVSFYYVPEEKKDVGMVTNIVKSTVTPASPLLKELVMEMNDLYHQVVALKETASQAAIKEMANK